MKAAVISYSYDGALTTKKSGYSSNVWKPKEENVKLSTLFHDAKQIL